MTRIVFVPLLDEGTTIWRPVEAENVAPDIFRLLGNVPDGERWQFQPGENVRCELRLIQDGPALIAVEATGSAT